MLEGALGLNFLVDIAEADRLRLLYDRQRHGEMAGGVEDHCKGNQSPRAMTKAQLY